MHPHSIPAKLRRTADLSPSYRGARWREKGAEAENTREVGVSGIWEQILGFDIPATSPVHLFLHTLGHKPPRLSPCHPVGAARGQQSWGGRKVSQQNLGFTSCLEHRESLYKYPPQQLLLSPLFSLLLLRPGSQAGRLQPLTFPWSHSLAPGQPGGCLGQK